MPEFAARLAAGLLCEAGIEPARRPCGGCDACRWFASGNHPDFRRLEPEAAALRRGTEIETGEGEEESQEEAGGRRGRKLSEEIRVGQIRSLADFLNIGSHRRGQRLVLIELAEDMNSAAANALLKSLEEPPAGARFLLVSARPARLPPTLRSRCVSVPLRMPSQAQALEWLAAEGVTEGAQWLAFTGGAPLLARTLSASPDAEAWRALLRAATAGELERLAGTVTDRESLGRYAEVVHRLAHDRVLRAAGRDGRYFPQARPALIGLRAAVSAARAIDGLRRQADHPLNPRLAAYAMARAISS